MLLSGIMHFPGPMQKPGASACLSSTAGFLGDLQPLCSFPASSCVNSAPSSLRQASSLRLPGRCQSA